MNFRDWLGSMLLHKSQLEAELFGVLAWQIWSSRNDFIFEKISISPELCFKKAYDILVEYNKATEGSFEEKACRRHVKWSSPDPSTIKVNVDAAVNMKEDKFGIGVVACNDAGEVLLAASKTLWPFVSVERAELEAVQWFMELIKDHQFIIVMVEGDSQNVMKALQRITTRGFHNQVLVDNILAASSTLDHISFSFCFR